MKLTAEFENKPEALVVLKELNDMIETKTITNFGEGLLLRYANAIIAWMDCFDVEQLSCETYTPEPPPISEHRWPGGGD